MKIHIAEKEAAADAEERFFRICGFNLEAAGWRSVEEEVFAVRAGLRTQLNIRAVVRAFAEPILLEDTLQLGDISLHCHGFEQIPKDAVKGALAYLLTIGETSIEEERNVMLELYHDIWCTAYVEAAMEVLRKNRILPLLEENRFLSAWFGPGYYGMSMKAGDRIFHLFDGATVGVTKKTGGYLIPEKSCMGVALVCDREFKMPQACVSCLGGHDGCRFCEKNIYKETE